MALKGVVLSGGRSRRMGKDKGSLVYQAEKNQRLRCYELLSRFCDSVVISCRSDQIELLPEGLPYVVDHADHGGPACGILSASRGHPSSSLYVFACDFPAADAEALYYLVTQRQPKADATVYRNSQGWIEPLFAIWEPSAIQALEARFRQGLLSPREALEALDCKAVAPKHEISLVNVNSLKEMHDFERRHDQGV